MSNCSSKSSLILCSALTSAIVAGAVSFSFSHRFSANNTTNSIKVKYEQLTAEVSQSKALTQRQQRKIETLLAENKQLKQKAAESMDQLSDVRQNKLETKIQHQEQLVAQYRKRLQDFSKESGIVYFNGGASAPSTNKDSNRKATATDYTTFNLMTQEYEIVLADLNSLRAAAELEQLKENMKPQNPSE